MELQFGKTTCRCLNRAAREVRNEELTQEVRLPDGMPDVGRVIAAWGQVILRSKGMARIAPSRSASDTSHFRLKGIHPSTHRASEPSSGA